jgi:hypothetical protein
VMAGFCKRSYAHAEPWRPAPNTSMRMCHVTE